MYNYAMFDLPTWINHPPNQPRPWMGSLTLQSFLRPKKKKKTEAVDYQTMY